MIEKQLGKELELEIKLEGSEAVIAVEHEGSLGSAKVELRVDAVKLVDKITDIIPGEWDDALLDELAKKMLSKKSE